ncbi:hypothetical protein SLEP1_g7681 [Rubroshorea leprosula]|uniref:Uncharacterized protein n=1 Tax=Rubroshorea leprosula TaxID=152421 RepID=A0AAV5I5H0_9ROSI|nr:hypothetical protein SLEP1_g7681 [Rubroshorea leprosula]
MQKKKWDRFEGYGIQSEMALETVSQLKGILRRGSKGGHQSGDAD